MKSLKNINAYSLAEFLVATLIFSFTLMGFYQLLNFVQTRSFVDNTNLLLQQQARNGIDRFVREIRESSSSTITVIDANNDRITFNTPNETGIQYYRSGNRLVREYPSGTIKNVSDYIAYFKCSKSGAVLTVNIRAQQTLYNKAFSILLVEKVRLRNE